jgi:hypothetical protein
MRGGGGDGGGHFDLRIAWVNRPPSRHPARSAGTVMIGVQAVGITGTVSLTVTR